VSELNFITEMVEEQIVKGNLRWLANFNEIHRDYAIEDVVFPIYSSGGLQEKGFFLSRIYSAMVTPRYKVHLFLYTSPEINPKLLRKLIISCKNKFSGDDWVFLALVQSRPFEKEAKHSIINVTEKTIGITAYSLASKETVSSSNVLGKGLAKQLKLAETKFESYNLPKYLRSYTIVFGLGILILIVIALSFNQLRQAISPLTILFMALFSLVAAHFIYKARYHAIISLNSKGFKLQEGQNITEGKWSDYRNVTIYITPRHETCLRLHSKDNTLDIPLSKIGLSRKEAYNAIKQLIRKKQSFTQ